MTAIPQVGIFDHTDSSKFVGQVPLPGVFKSPIRLDIVHFVHTNLTKNSRQARGVDPMAGMRHAAISWGPGRAVARIPRVTGSGSQRTGQGAFGNMTRKGHMFAPLKIWRRWHRKVNLNQRRYAICSALAASAITPLVMARGHAIDRIPNLPLVVDDKIQTLEKTHQVIGFLKLFNAYDDVERVCNARIIRPGKGKARGRRFATRVGPLFVHNNRESNLIKAVRNIQGIDVAHVASLDLRQLAPGAHLGRFIIWTKSAFEALDGIFGTPRLNSTEKSGFSLQRHVLTNADISRIINSNEVQSIVRDPQLTAHRFHDGQKKNPLKNPELMRKLNPFQAKLKARNANLAKKKKKSASTAASRKAKNTRRVQSKEFMSKAMKKIERAQFGEDQ